MSNFDLALQFVLKAEGGYSSHPNDRGGQTNYGITKGTLNDAKRLGIIDNTISSVKDLTLDDAQKIYKEMYWDKINGNALPTDLSIALFDTAVNMGDKNSVKMLQGILGVTQDGIIGPQTLAAIQNYNGNLVDDFLNAREARYETIAKQPSQGVFLKGWLNRVSTLKDYIGTINEGAYDEIDGVFLPLWIKDSFQDLINKNTSLYSQFFTTALGTGATITRRDPLILDLDRDGVETTNVKDGAYFDHDGNGFAEQTGWAGADDGILVMDRNGDGIINDGKELFGDQTILSNGQRASNGFQALSELDSNSDGKIDSNDTAFNNLKVWQDADGDGYSTADELKSLSDAGITSINLNSTPSTATDPQGNTQTRISSFERTDGTAGTIGEYNLQRDTAYTIANEWLDVPPEIAVLPDLQGYGNVYDLQQAMAREAGEVAYGRKKDNNIIPFVKRFYLLLSICLFLSLALFVLPAHSENFKLIKVNSHYEPEISEGIILHGTNIKAGVFTYVIDEAKADVTSKAGLLIKDKIYYVESERYAHITPKGRLDYVGEFDTGGDPNFGVYKNYFVMDAYASGASHNRKMFLFRFNEDAVQLLDVIVEAYVNKIGMDFISAYEETDKVALIGEIPRIFKHTSVSWINIKDVDGDGKPEFKVVIREKWFELYFEIANDRLQVDFNPDLYKPLFAREKLKKTKRKSDAYYIYGFLAKELDLKKIKAMLEGTGKKPYEQYGRVVALLEGHKKWDSAFHDYLGEKPILKQYNLKRR